MKDAAQIFGSITRIEADKDWDGISAAAQIARYYPISDVNISAIKIVESDEKTVVLDKQTFDRCSGWVIDHHKGSTSPKNILSLSEDGLTPTSTLVYRLLPHKDDTDLFLSATAEITEGLDEHGWRHGSLKEFAQKYPDHLKQSKYQGQYLRREELYSIADVLALLSTETPQENLELAKGLSPAKVASADDLIDLLNEKQKSIVGRYFEFMKNLPREKFRPMKVGGFDVRVTDRDELEFAYPALARMEEEEPGNYLLKRRKAVSIRTDNPRLIEYVVNRLGDRVESYGGRVRWWAVALKEPLSYQEFLNLIKK